VFCGGDLDAICLFIFDELIALSHAVGIIWLKKLGETEFLHPFFILIFDEYKN
jgi:hypothetical protein